MTTNQALALWELCRAGLPLIADDAAKRWSQGDTFELTEDFRLSRGLEALIDQCNWEAQRFGEAA